LLNSSALMTTDWCFSGKTMELWSHKRLNIFWSDNELSVETLLLVTSCLVSVTKTDANCAILLVYFSQTHV
jgi:hypothetical protein